MKKLLIYTDKSRFNEFSKNANDLVKHIDSLYHKLTNWDAIQFTFEDLCEIINKVRSVNRISPTYLESLKGKGQIANYPELQKVFEDFLKEKAINQTDQPKVFGFNISKNKLKEMIEIPSIPIEIFEAMDQLLLQMNNSQGLRVDPTYFELSENKIIVNLVAMKEFKKDCSYYATTKKQIEFTQEVFKVCDALNKFKIVGDGLFKLEVTAVNALHNAILHKNGKFYPDYSFIITFMQ
jgi:hypothetical protein